MRPTLRAVLLAVLGIPIALVVVLVSVDLWMVWLAYVVGLAAAVGADAVLALPRRSLEIVARPPSPLYIGSVDPMPVVVAGGGKARAAIELLVELSAHLEPIAGTLTARLGRERRVELEVDLVPRRRGKACVRAIWARWTGPLGLTRRRETFELGLDVPVIPNVRAVRREAIRLFSRNTVTGLKIDRHRGDGSAFEALREYVDGFDPRAIDWKHSARHRKLVCKEFRAERNHQIIVAIDTGHLMSEPIESIPRLDWAINAGLLLAYVSLRGGDRVGLYGFDSRARLYTEPQPGVGAFPRLQRMSSDLEYNHDETNFTLGLAELATRLRRRSLIILLTDFTDSVTAELMVENIQRLIARHLVLFVSMRNPGTEALVARRPAGTADIARAVVADDLIRDREVVLERLRRRGVHCIDALPGQISASLVSRYLDIKRRELI